MISGHQVIHQWCQNHDLIIYQFSKLTGYADLSLKIQRMHLSEDFVACPTNVRSLVVHGYRVNGEPTVHK